MYWIVKELEMGSEFLTPLSLSEFGQSKLVLKPDVLMGQNFVGLILLSTAKTSADEMP